MTRKLAVLGLPCGGGKAVLAVPEIPAGDGRRRLLERYGDLIESLGGSYVTGPDVNTREEDMDVIGSRTAHVFCRSLGNGGSGDPSIHTALGVFHGIRATLAHAFGSDDPTGRTVLVQGTGAVGAKLTRLLLDAGAVVLVSDVDEERARATGAQPVAPDTALELECDVYAPCALGATLSADSIPLLRCRIVAGGANNQLATPEDGERLRAAGILYAPDYVINGGGALHGIGLERLGWDARPARTRGSRDRRDAHGHLPARRGGRDHDERRRRTSSRRSASPRRNRRRSALASRLMARWPVVLALVVAAAVTSAGVCRRSRPAAADPVPLRRRRRLPRR